MLRRGLPLALVLFGAAEAFARVGGGSSYSGGGGGSSDGGGGGGGGAELLFYVFRFLFWLTIQHPVIGIPVDVVVIVVIVRWWSKKETPAVLAVSTSAPSRWRLEELRRFDPNFSAITFSDFCYSLYARAHHARGTGTLDHLAPYLSSAARAALRQRGQGRSNAVKGIVIGSFQVTQVRGLDTPQVSVTVSYEANYTEAGAQGDASWYVREQWTLERQRDILSPPPEKAKADHCPRCGAALATRTDGSCEYCGVKIESGAFQWYVRSIQLMERDARGPLLTSDVPEQGTDLPTVFQLQFGAKRAAFERDHPDFQWPAFDARVREIATELQNAWTGRDWERVRPLETEPLFQMHRYWIDAYRRQGLTNVVADYRILRIEPVKVDTDAFYEAITVRMWAEGRDHTVDGSGRVVAGSDARLRTWSEYWTLIRNRTASGGTKQVGCPNCGAQVDVGATGVCPYCGGKLTTGTFDWVLSRIEQDEAYGAA